MAGVAEQSATAGFAVKPPLTAFELFCRQERLGAAVTIAAAPAALCDTVRATALVRASSGRDSEERQLAEGSEKAVRLARKWGQMTPEQRAPFFQRAARTAEGTVASGAAGGSGRFSSSTSSHSPAEVQRLRAIAPVDERGGVPSWCCARIGDHAAFRQLCFSFGVAKPLLGTRATGWRALVLRFGKAPLPPANASGWGQATFLTWELVDAPTQLPSLALTTTQSSPMSELPQTPPARPAARALFPTGTMDEYAGLRGHQIGRAHV